MRRKVRKQSLSSCCGWWTSQLTRRHLNHSITASTRFSFSILVRPTSRFLTLISFKKCSRPRIKFWTRLDYSVVHWKTSSATPFSSPKRTMCGRPSARALDMPSTKKNLSCNLIPLRITFWRSATNGRNKFKRRPTARQRWTCQRKLLASSKNLSSTSRSVQTSSIWELR